MNPMTDYARGVRGAFADFRNQKIENRNRLRLAIVEGCDCDNEVTIDEFGYMHTHQKNQPDAATQEPEGGLHRFGKIKQRYSQRSRTRIARRVCQATRGAGGSNRGIRLRRRDGGAAGRKRVVGQAEFCAGAILLTTVTRKLLSSLIGATGASSSSSRSTGHSSVRLSTCSTSTSGIVDAIIDHPNGLFVVSVMPVSDEGEHILDGATGGNTLTAGITTGRID